jgi:hypothetical protein
MVYAPPWHEEQQLVVVLEPESIGDPSAPAINRIGTIRNIIGTTRPLLKNLRGVMLERPSFFQISI